MALVLTASRNSPGFRDIAQELSMADPLSITAGVVGLATCAIQSSKVLYGVIDDARNNGKTMRELEAEIGSLTTVLESIENTVAITEENLTAVQIPVIRCGELCKEFAALISRCSAHAKDGNFSFRDTLTSILAAKEVTQRRSLIGAYKSTIAIALADADIRHITFTAKLFQEYKETIGQTTTDLDDLLRVCDQAESGLSSPVGSLIEHDDTETTDVVSERASIEKCLDICMRVSRHIDDLWKELLPAQDETAAREQQTIVVEKSRHTPTEVTSERLEDCNDRIAMTTSEHRRRLQEVDRQLNEFSRRSQADENYRPDADRDASELANIKRCLSICQEATDKLSSERVNVFEDISIADDGDQAIVSTSGDLISARRVNAGARSTQIFGQMSDESIQAMTKLHASRRGQVTKPPSGETHGNDSARSGKENAPEPPFTRYGTGRKV